jgi:sugar lactone lactonase YvrE
MHIVSAAIRQNVLGESPLWSRPQRRLYWLDIEERLLEWLDPQTNEAGAWRLSLRASAIAERTSGGLLLATEFGPALFDLADGKMKIMDNPEPDRPSNRSNDGHADANGRFWFSTMDSFEQRRCGALYRLDADWTCTRVIDGLGIPNTVLCTPDCTRLYLAESKDRLIYAYNVDAESGALGERRVFATTEGSPATPDGSALDAEGFLWNAQWGGWRVVRYSPVGEIERIVSLPVEQPTACAFGGEDLAILYITTATKGLSAQSLAKQPLAGSVLSFRAGVAGSPMPMFGG